MTLDKSAHRMAVGKLTGGEQQQRRRGGRTVLRDCGIHGRLRQTNQITFAAANVAPIAQTRLVLETTNEKFNYNVQTRRINQRFTRTTRLELQD